MKEKISSLEKAGVRPSRENVLPHLNRIKQFSKQPVKSMARPVRAPVKLSHQFQAGKHLCRVSSS